mgnify:CR=1 FL=1
MSDISKIINNSIQRVINEDAKEAVDALGALGKNAKEYYDQSIDSLSKGELGEMIADKKEELKAKVLGKIAKAVGGSTADEKFEMEKKLAKVRADELLKAEEAAREASNAEHAERATVGHHAKEYANELWSKTKKFGQDNFTLDPDKIDLPKTGMTGAAIAAGLGALALRRRMKKAQKGQ